MTPRFDATMPVLPVFDVPKAREFYLDVLGMSRIGGIALEPPRLPSHSGLWLLLSQHCGDGTPATKLISGLGALQAEPSVRDDRQARCAIIEQPRRWRDMEVRDPFGSRLVFTEATEEAG